MGSYCPDILSAPFPTLFRRGDSPSGGEGGRLYVKGAPDVLLRKCTRMMQADGALVPMPDAESLQLGDSSLRVIALAFKDGGSVRLRAALTQPLHPYASRAQMD